MSAVLGSRPSALELASRSWASVRMAFRQMPVLYGALFVGDLILVTTSYYLDKYPDDAIQHLIGGLLSLLLDLFFLSVSAVAMHRFILLDEVSGPAVRPTSPYVWRFSLWLIGISLIFAAPFIAAEVFGRFIIMLGLFSRPYFVGIGLVAFAADIFLFVRLVMVFPAVAVGDFRNNWRVQMDTSWQQMRGCFWLLVGGGLLITWPLLLAHWLLLAIKWSGSSLDKMLWYKLIDGGVISYLFSILGVSVVSWLYAWVRQQPTTAVDPA